MTREEYEKLLKSDYWKGYSYSLIKERNFTCEECGRYFPNQRNKLQVHHLVYRDANPWSYQPHELVVLCEDCHKRMHGIHVDPVVDDNPFHKSGDNPLNENPFGDNPFNENPFGGSSLDDNPFTKEGDNPFDDNPFTAPRKNPFDDNTFNKSAERVYTPVDEKLVYPEEKKDKSKYILIACLLVMAGYFGYSMLPKSSQNEREMEGFIAEEVEVVSDENLEYPKSKVKKTINAKNNIGSSTIKESSTTLLDEIDANDETEQIIESDDVISDDYDVIPISEPTQTQTKSTVERIKDKSHHNAVEQAMQEDVSSEGSTLDIYNRISHKHAVEQAKKEGVSSEGSTLDIYNRISQKHAVEQAKKEGVSSEGSTLDIYNRISHKHAVEQAKKEGVSSEGSTLDIYNRISSKKGY